MPEDLPEILIDLLDCVMSERSMAPIVGRPEGLRCCPFASRDESGWALLMKPCDSARPPSTAEHIRAVFR